MEVSKEEKMEISTSTSVSDKESSGSNSNSHAKHLDDRMKEYENGYKMVVDPSKPYIIRLDGHGFSKFVKPFNKPYDVRIHNAMVKTAAELLNVFGATTAFTCSDEITLIFPAVIPSVGCEAVEDPTPSEELSALFSKTRGTNNNNTKKSSESSTEVVDSIDPQSKVIYGGRIQKIVSYSAGLASVAFLANLKAESYDPEKDARLISILSTAHPYFDSRIFSVPSNTEVLNNVLWRHKFDYRRNSVSGLARHHFTQKELHGLHSGDQLAKMSAKGVEWSAEPGWYKWGSFIKKQMKASKALNPKTNEEVPVVRTRIVEKNFGMEGFTKDNLDFLLCKHIAEDDEQVQVIVY